MIVCTHTLKNFSRYEVNFFQVKRFQKLFQRLFVGIRGEQLKRSGPRTSIFFTNFKHNVVTIFFGHHFDFANNRFCGFLKLGQNIH